MPEVGFEPTRTIRPADLKSAPLDLSGIQARQAKTPITATHFAVFDQVNPKPKECASRESNPGLVRGRDVYYHCTTSAEFRRPRHMFAPQWRLSAEKFTKFV